VGNLSEGRLETRFPINIDIRPTFTLPCVHTALLYFYRSTFQHDLKILPEKPKDRTVRMNILALTQRR